MRTEKFVKKWGEERKKGKKFYVLTACVVVGLASFVGVVIGNLATGGFLDSNNLIYVIGVLIGGLIGGAIGGVLKWNSNEGSYNQFSRSDLRK